MVNLVSSRLEAEAAVAHITAKCEVLHKESRCEGRERVNCGTPSPSMTTAGLTEVVRA
ncbi:hypothetical protein SBA7_610010 [Candidatus Sulfotelmatobacter sp. SbA7]|nr:hypothetical protein SBA7_610010 [Candidatus Sulfotelmatobacter sp. SbA7]